MRKTRVKNQKSYKNYLAKAMWRIFGRGSDLPLVVKRKASGISIGNSLSSSIVLFSNTGANGAADPDALEGAGARSGDGGRSCRTITKEKFIEVQIDKIHIQLNLAKLQKN